MLPSHRWTKTGVITTIDDGGSCLSHWAWWRGENDGVGEGAINPICPPPGYAAEGEVKTSRSASRQVEMSGSKTLILSVDSAGIEQKYPKVDNINGVLGVMG